METKTCDKCGGGGRVASHHGLREIRESAGLTLTALAAEIKLSVPYLSDVERGRRNVTRRLAKIYQGLEDGNGIRQAVR